VPGSRRPPFRSSIPRPATGGAITVEGWVADASLKAPASFSVVLAGPATFAMPAVADVAREDVAAALGSPDLARAGFGASGSIADVAAGEYSLQLLVEHQDGRRSLCATGVQVAVGGAG
jgi:hypothetical protein